MNQSIVFMFSGQGTQYYQMGKNLYHNNKIFRDCMLRLNEMVFHYTGTSIVDELYNKDKSMLDAFHEIQYTHPSIFMTEYSMAHMLMERGVKPDYLFGMSLGEYTCFALAKIMPLEDVIECIVRQADMLAADFSDSEMMVIIDSPDLYKNVSWIHDNSEMVSIIDQNQFVISGYSKKIDLIRRHLHEKKVVCQRLTVDYGFHADCIDKIHNEYTDFLQTKKYKSPSIPYISCMKGDEVNEADSRFLWEVVRSRIKFQEALMFLEHIGTHIYIDVGPSGSMANYVRRNHIVEGEKRIYSIMTPFQQENKYLQHIEDNLQTKKF